MRLFPAAAAVILLLAHACTTAPIGDGVQASSPSTTTAAPTVSLQAPRVATPLGGPGLAPVLGESYVNPGAVVAQDGRWWALANSFTAFPGASRTDLFVSDDLATWDRVATDPVLTDQDASNVRGSLFTTAVVPNDGGWVAFLYDYAGQRNPGSIHRATAAALEGPWTVDDTPVLEPGPPGAWDERRLAEPEVVRGQDGTWLLWFTGYDADGQAAIGLATSADGRTWTRSRDPVVTGDHGWTRGSVDGPQVVATQDGFVMTYASAVRRNHAVGLAFSPDGHTWEPWAGNPVVTPDDLPDGGALFQNALVADDDRVVLLQESGSGAVGTVVHAVAIDVHAARQATLPVLQPTWTVDGDTVTVSVDVDGIDLRFERGSQDPAVAHAHVYVDLPPPPAGADVPLGRDRIVHARGGTVRVTGLQPGPHDLWVVLADGQDRALGIPTPVRLRVTVS